VLLVETQESERAERMIAQTGGEWTYRAWDCLRGIRNLPNGLEVEEETNPIAAMEYLAQHGQTIMVAHNLHLFFDAPEVIQATQNHSKTWKSIGSCLVIVSPRVKLRSELEKLIHLVTLPLPAVGELFALQAELLKGLESEDGTPTAVEPDAQTALMARGLTESEAETAFALSLVRNGTLDPRVITEVKGQMVKKSGLMESWPPVDPSQVGGLEQLKSYIANRTKAFAPGNEHLPRPKGILLVGIPGTGKSLACKATASILGWPLIRLDVSALKSSLVGESEQRMRAATQVIDAFGECVVWLDEIEKGFAGVQGSGHTDSGTSAAMFGHFLVWMQETTSPVLVMATANDISQLPPEFLRAGRFDAIFFVDLPGIEERKEILKIQNARYGASIDENYAVMALDGYTGAEIEQLAKDSLFDGYEEAVRNIVPLARSAKEKITSLREWAKARARMANTREETTGVVRRLARK
jgi:hypothetical protein